MTTPSELKQKQAGLRYLDGGESTVVADPGDLSRTNDLGHNSKTWMKIRMASIDDEVLDNFEPVD